MLGIDGAGKPGDEILNQRLTWYEILSRRGHVAHGLKNPLGVGRDLLGIVLIGLRETQQHRHKRGAAEALLLWKIRAAPEWSRWAVEKHRQRPAALLAQAVQRSHVDGVDVGPLFAVDFDVHEQLVHDLSRRFVLEALVRHDVTPVAGGVPDREQDWLVGPLGFGERLGAPGPPVHRVVLMLEQIGAGLVLQSVFTH